MPVSKRLHSMYAYVTLGVHLGTMRSVLFSVECILFGSLLPSASTGLFPRAFDSVPVNFSYHEGNLDDIFIGAAFGTGL